MMVYHLMSQKMKPGLVVSSGLPGNGKPRLHGWMDRPLIPFELVRAESFYAFQWTVVFLPTLPLT